VAISGASYLGQYDVVFLMPYSEGLSRIPERKEYVSKTIALVPGWEAANFVADEEVMLLYSWTMVLFGSG
jgi:hypothetical protein